jgi:hypothetical protein
MQDVSILQYRGVCSTSQRYEFQQEYFEDIGIYKTSAKKGVHLKKNPSKRIRMIRSYLLVKPRIFFPRAAVLRVPWRALRAPNTSLRDMSAPSAISYISRAILIRDRCVALIAAIIDNAHERASSCGNLHVGGPLHTSPRDSVAPALNMQNHVVCV